MESLDRCFWTNGPKPGSFYNLKAGHANTNLINNPVKHTTQPIVTGSSVLGIKFDGGVMLAADTLGSYGNLARYRNCERLMKVNNSTLLGVSGDYADYQYLRSVIEQKVIDDQCANDGGAYTPKSLFSWLTRILYHRRSKMNPLWNTVLVGGMQEGEPFLGYVDKIGTAFVSPVCATGFGAYVALPLMRDSYERNNKMSETEAKTLLDECMKILYYRDCRAWNTYDLAVINNNGVTVVQKKLNTNWEIATMVKGYE